MLFPKIQAYFDSLDIQAIPEDRRAVLTELRQYIRGTLERAGPVNLTFICTHNSRRSHLGQVWAQVAATYYGFGQVATYSGGTETTACNPRTIAALERAGLHCVQSTEGENPVYEIRFAEVGPPIVAFSKVFDQSPNPAAHFAAIMTCSHADKNCPYIPGADVRLPITYLDPKESDDTPAERGTYDARCRQIAAEMKYVFSQV